MKFLQSLFIITKFVHLLFIIVKLDRGDLSVVQNFENNFPDSSS